MNPLFLCLKNPGIKTGMTIRSMNVSDSKRVFFYKDDCQYHDEDGYNKGGGMVLKHVQ